MQLKDSSFGSLSMECLLMPKPLESSLHFEVRLFWHWLVCNFSSVIWNPILLKLRKIFLIYCINCGKCKRCLIRNLAFSGDVKVILFPSALKRRMRGKSGQCTLCFPLLLVTTEPQYWEVKIHLYTAQQQPVLLDLCLGYGEVTGILSFPGIWGCHLPCGTILW